jgi:hypothetical protein
MRRWGALVIVWGLGAVSGSMVGWTSALFTSTASNPGNSFAAAASFCSTPSTQTASASQDSYTREDQTGTNFGTSTTLNVQSRTGQARRTFISFSLPAKPAGCLVSSAFLRLYATSSSFSGRTIEAFGASASWTETGITWSNAPGTIGTASTSASGTAPAWKEWVVTSLVESMYSGTNDGFVLKDTSETGGFSLLQIYQSREGTTDTHDPQLVIAFSDAVCTSPGSQTVATNRDSYIDEANPNSNFGTDTALYVQSQSSSRNLRSLVYFPFPAIPTDCVLTGATLRLNATAADTGRTIGAYRAQATPSWTETGVTWNNRPFFTGTGPAATGSSGTGWLEWDVTTQVGAMYAGTNNGFIVRDLAEGASPAQTQTFSSREGSNDPQLVLRFG